MRYFGLSGMKLRASFGRGSFGAATEPIFGIGWGNLEWKNGRLVVTNPNPDLVDGIIGLRTNQSTITNFLGAACPAKFVPSPRH